MVANVTAAIESARAGYPHDIIVVDGGSTDDTVLKGEVTIFSLELPPYRPPQLWRTLYTSLIDRTYFVLWRTVLFALSAGAVIWLTASIHIGDGSLATHFIRMSSPWALLFGLNGVILLAYIIAIPANEIIVPTILMLTVMATGTQGVGEGAGVMFELDSDNAIRQLLTAGGFLAETIGKLPWPPRRAIDWLDIRRSVPRHVRPRHGSGRDSPAAERRESCHPPWLGPDRVAFGWPDGDPPRQP